MTESPTTLRATEQTLASPAFLTQLQPAASAAVSTSRWALLAAQATTSAGFSIARSATSLGFSGARAVVSALPGGVGVVGGVTLAAAEQAALFGIGIGQGFTDLVLGSASTLAASLNAVYGNDEALRTLAAFLELVQREWTTSLETDPYPEGGLSRWTLSDVGRAAATWSALQSVTAEWEGERVCAELEELDLATWGRGASEQKENEVVWEVTEEQLLETGEEVIQATIEGEEERRGPSTQDERTREHLKRFSRMALGTYGGVGALFFGVKLPSVDPASTASKSLDTQGISSAASRHDEEVALQHAVEDGSATTPASDPVAVTVEDALAHVEQLESSMMDAAEIVEDIEEDFGMHASPAPKSFDFLGLLTGKHDEAILHSLAGVEVESAPPHEETSDDEDDVTSPAELERQRAARKADREARQRSKNRTPPRFFVVTDHPNRTILLLIRGTLSIDDVATDLACEPSAFDPSLYWDEECESQSFLVHGGIMEMTLAMGGHDGPVTRAVAKALKRNPSYELTVVGHSLGAGVASLLALTWADPTSALTTSKSGLPAGKRVQVYGFATPCVTDPELSRRCQNLIHTFIYSSDAVSRFSLGHIKDIRSAAAWLCFANSNPEPASNNILSRIIAYKRGQLDDDLPKKAEEASWFCSLRRALEANQGFADLFPPGDILWLTRGDDLALPSDAEGMDRDAHRLFKVTGRPEVVFKQMMFGFSMLSSHLPHRYMQVIDSFL